LLIESTEKQLTQWKDQFLLQGAGVQWLRDRMKFFKKASDTEKLVKSLKIIIIFI
jgi:glycerol kinase